MSDRKRKRESSGVEKPRKKRTYSPSTQPPSQPPKSITIELPTDTAAVKPLLVTTPGLEIHSSTSFRIYESSAHELLLHSSPHPASNLDFTGRLQLRAEHASKTPPAYRNYIAVFDPVTSTLQILPALPLEIRRSFRPTAKDLAAEASRAVKQTAMVQRQQLGLEFGTKKAKKLIESRTTNAIQSGRGPAAAAAASDSASQGQDRTVGPSQQSLPGELDDPLTRAVLQSISESVSHMPTRAEMQQEADAAKPRPKPDLSATSLEAVYPVALLVGADELQLVDVTGWEQAVAGKMPVRTRSRFVSERIVRTVGEGGVEKLKALRFLLGLVDYHQALVKSGGGGRAGATKKVLEAGKLREVLGMEGALASRINGRFSTDKRTCDKWHQEYLLTHICALALYIDNFETEFYDLRNDLNLETRQMTNYFREIGAQVAQLTEKEQQRMKLTRTAANQRRMARLKLPLEFPKVPIRKRK